MKAAPKSLALKIRTPINIGRAIGGLCFTTLAPQATELLIPKSDTRLVFAHDIQPSTATLS